MMVLTSCDGGCPAATYYCRIDPRGEVTPRHFMTSRWRVAPRSAPSEDLAELTSLRRAPQARADRGKVRRLLAEAGRTIYELANGSVVEYPAAHQLAMESDRVRADVIEASEFPTLSQRFGVSAVPLVVINDSVSLVGARSESQLVQELLQAAA